MAARSHARSYRVSAWGEEIEGMEVAPLAAWQERDSGVEHPPLSTRRNPILLDRQCSIRAWIERRLALSESFLALRLQNHNADSVPGRVTQSAWRKVHKRYRAQIARVEPKVIEEILAGRNCAAT